MIRRALTVALVAAYRGLCAVTLHRWHYHPNEHGGKPMLRVCVHCGRRQTWNYDTARSSGRIEWIDTPLGDWCEKCGVDVYLNGKCCAWGCGHTKGSKVAHGVTGRPTPHVSPSHADDPSCSGKG